MIWKCGHPYLYFKCAWYSKVRNILKKYVTGKTLEVVKCPTISPQLSLFFYYKQVIILIPDTKSKDDLEKNVLLADDQKMFLAVKHVTFLLSISFFANRVSQKQVAKKDSR